MVPIELPDAILVTRKLVKRATANNSTWEGRLKNNETPVIVKVLHEYQSEKSQNEIRAYKRLRKSMVVPEVHFLGAYKENWIIVLIKEGPSLHDLMKKSKFSMTLESISLLAIKMISLLEKMHSDNIVHNQLSPKCILLGRKLCTQRLYLIGFKSSIKLLANSHVEMLTENSGEREIDLFSSVNKCLNILQAKKDDLESLLYILLYLIRNGRLSDRLIEKEGRFRSLLEINRWKTTTSPDIICEKLPLCFSSYLSYIRALNSQERPNYNYLRSLFSKNISESNLSKNLGQLIAYDIVKILAAQRSKTPSEGNSVCKATLASEKNFADLDIEDDISENFQNKLPGLNPVHSLKEIHWKLNECELDEKDDENYNEERVSSKMESLAQFEESTPNFLNSIKGKDTFESNAHKEVTSCEVKINRKSQGRESESKECTDLAETRRHEDKESLEEFFDRARLVNFMVRHGEPK